MVLQSRRPRAIAATVVAASVAKAMAAAPTENAAAPAIGLPRYTPMRAYAAAGSSTPMTTDIPSMAATSIANTTDRRSIVFGAEKKYPLRRRFILAARSCKVPIGQAVEQYMRPVSAVAAAHNSSHAPEPASRAGIICHCESQHEYPHATVAVTVASTASDTAMRAALSHL